MKKLIIIIALVLGACAAPHEAPAPIEININDLADLILESAEFPAMITSTEENGTEKIIRIQQALSVHLVEIILITPATDEAAEFLRARQKELREQLAFYPAQILSAEASVTGTLHNIAYLICHEEAAEIERIIKSHEKIPAF
jgi:hypothetical protein